MFENENNEKNTNNQPTENSTANYSGQNNSTGNYNQANSNGNGYGYGAGNGMNNVSGSSYGAGSGYGAGNSTGNGYGAGNISGTGYGSGSSYGAGSSASGNYGAGNTSGSSAGGYGTYSGNTGYTSNNNVAGTNTYQSSGNYSGTNYGTYQYGNYQQPGGGAQPPKKKNTGKKVAAAIAVAMVLVLGLGAGYYSMTKMGVFKSGIADQTEESARIEEKDTDKALEQNEDASGEDKVAKNSADSEETEESSEDTETASTDNSSSGISKTPVTGEAQAVVTDVTAVVAAAMPSIVSINNNYTESGSYFGQTFTEELTASGSGILVGTNETELLIMTNYHVIEGADSLEVQFVDESTASAEVKGTDSDMDLAVIAVQLSDLSNDTKGAIAIASLGDSDDLVVGEPAIAIGNALGYGQSVTTGVISAVNRVIDLDDKSGSKSTNLIQTDAAINPGNSGGALLNIKGEVIGINSSKIGGSTVEGMGYAIPISTAKPIIEQLMTEKTRAKVSEENRGYIGISGVSVTSEVSEMYGLPTGVYVASVHEGGGGAAAGLKENDIITEFDGKEISSMEDLQNRLEYYEAGEVVSLTIMRQSDNGYTEQQVEITLGNSSTLETSDSQEENETYQGAPKESQESDEGTQQEMPFGFGSDGWNFGFDFGY